MCESNEVILETVKSPEFHSKIIYRSPEIPEITKDI